MGTNEKKHRSLVVERKQRKISSFNGGVTMVTEPSNA